VKLERRKDGVFRERDKIGREHLAIALPGLPLLSWAALSQQHMLPELMRVAIQYLPPATVQSSNKKMFSVE
jgi:hypothetical protein